MGIYYVNTRKTWAVNCRIEGKYYKIGEYETPEEASMAYVTYKINRNAQYSPSDLKRIERYKSYCEFCMEPRTLSELFAYFKKCNTNSVRHNVDYLVKEGFLVKLQQAAGGSTKDKYKHKTIKMFKDADLKPMGRAQVQKLKYDETMAAKSADIIPGARVINFESGPLHDKYMEQRKTDRKNMKSAKNYVSGSLMSNMDI